MEIISLKNINKYFGENKVLDDVSLTVKEGEVISIIGPSGSGKSTLLRSIIGLEEVKNGKISVEGELIFDNDMKISKHKIRNAHLKMGMVFQSFNLFPHKTVIDNIIEAPLMVKKMPKEEALMKARELLKLVGLSEKENSFPGELSGGQKQRIAIARALAMNPDILLFDEPTSALDPELVSEVLKVIKELAKQKITMLIVSHEMKFVQEISDQVIFMADGKVVESGAAEKIFNNPEHDRIKEFLKKIL